MRSKRTNLSGANLGDANLSRANLYRTTFGGTNLKGVSGLDTCRHAGPSFLDYQTLANSGQLPIAFLRGCGLPDRFIDYMPALLQQEVQFYSCFISYSVKDQDFADRLHADLQAKGEGLKVEQQ